MSALTKPGGQFVYINGAFVPEEKASLLVSDLAFQRGYGIFDFFATLRNAPLFLDDHLDRFYRSAAQMRLPVEPERAALKEILSGLISRNNMPDAGIRLTLTGGYSHDGYALNTPNLVITQKALQPIGQDTFEKGIRLVTWEHQRQLPGVKTIDYLMAIWLQPHLRQHGADDVLYQNNGIITECPRANFFIVTSGNEVATPAHNILHGIVRMKTLDLANARYTTAVRDITTGELEHASEAFITSTTRHVLPVVSINGARVGDGRPGAVSRWLNQQLEHAVREVHGL